MTTYKMTPIGNGTRLRVDHNTYAEVLTSFNIGDQLQGDEIWIAQADGSEVRKGDTWVHVTHKNGVELEDAGWVAYVHKAQFICKNFEVVGDTPPTDPAPVPSPVFPESFTLTDPSGRKAHYEFVREIE